MLVFSSLITCIYMLKSLRCINCQWACNLGDNRVPAHTLMKMGGWSSIDTVQQFYLKSSDANEKRAVGVLEELMEEGKSARI